MTKSLTTLAAVCALCAGMLAPTPARAMDPWTAALWLVSGVYIGSVYGLPYAYGSGAYRGSPYGYAPYGYTPHGYVAPAAYAAPTAYGAPPPAPAPVQRVVKGAEPCVPATMMIDGIERQVRICY
jgi:hypothetical protein